MIKPGDVFYTKRARTNVTKNKNYLIYDMKVWLVSLCLGAVQIGDDEPTPQQVEDLLGSVGLVGLDRIEECLGEPAMKKVIAYMEKRSKEDRPLEHIPIKKKDKKK